MSTEQNNSSAKEQGQTEQKSADAFRDVTREPEDLLYEDRPLMLGKKPENSSAEELGKYTDSSSRIAISSTKVSQFEFNGKSNPRGDNNMLSVSSSSENESKTNPNENCPVATSDSTVSSDCNENKHLKGNQKESPADTVNPENQTDVSNRIDASSERENENEPLTHPEKKEESEVAIAEALSTDTRSGTTKRKNNFSSVFLPEFTEEDISLLPKEIPEYEHVFDGPWRLGRTPTYLDASIPKGPTPPAPIEYIQKPLVGSVPKIHANSGDWNVEKTAPLLPTAADEEHYDKQWILDKTL